MNLKAFLTHLLKEDTPDEERGESSQESQVANPHALHETKHSQEVVNGARVTPQVNGATPEDNVDPESDQDDYDDTLSHLEVEPETNPQGPRRVLSRIFSALFPSPSNEEEIQAYIPHYRLLPIFSGIAIPFSILLNIPGLTADWYIRTSGPTTTVSKPNPPLLDIGAALSLLCAVLANICLIFRFLERRIKTMTILCVIFLSIHDAINVAALSTFGATKDGYTFSQAFWMTLCSTIVSMFTNVTLIIDLIRTPDFKRSGSGLTRRQRSLVIIIIGLFCYLAIGALINSLLLDLTFINGLYFTVVTIETIGFGDIVPNSRGSRIFICFYATIGIINLAFVVGYVRETVLEGLDFGYRRRLLAIRERRRAVRRRRRAEHRWRHAIVWRLRERQAPIWIPKKSSSRKSLWSMLTSIFWHIHWRILSTVRKSIHQTRRRYGTQLNLWALPPCQLEAAALEAGFPLDTFLPPDFYDSYDQDTCHHAAGAKHQALPSWFAIHPVYHRNEHSTEPLTQRRLAGMTAILTKLSFAVYESGGDPLPNRHSVQDASDEGTSEAAEDSVGTLQTGTSEDGDYHEDVADTEKKAYLARSGLSWGWFLVFWMGGAAIFQATEGWSYGTAVYFCFISFSTIGYGDHTPTTPAGRSIFVVWALIGVATMTIFISVVSEAYTSRYKGILGRNSFKHVARQYRERHKVELSEKVHRIGTLTGVEIDLRDTIEREETRVIQEETLTASPTAIDDATAPIASTSKDDRQVQHAQDSLENLPKQILTETRTIQQYMQLISDFDERSSRGTGQFVDKSISTLIDDVMSGKALDEGTKQDILKDKEARQTLMLLGIERSLTELVDISERAIAAVQERDSIIATLEREKAQDEADMGQG